MTATTTRSAPAFGGMELASLALGFVFAVAASAGILWHFHDAFWYAPDEGIYAHIAERLLNGEVMHRDVQDIHAGYVNFANALAFKVFGVNLISLRYPLVAMGVIQAALLYLLFARRGPVVAGTAAFTLSSLSTVQFLNPTAHWYCLFLFIVLLWIIHSMAPRSRGRLEAIGFLLVSLILFRQLSGALIAMGTVCYLLYEAQGSARRQSGGWIGQLVIAATALALGWYILKKTDLLGFALFGVWPLGVLLVVALKMRLANSTAISVLAGITLGGTVALVPLLAYHAIHGSLYAWFDDSVLTALSLTRLEFMSRASYLWLLGGGLIAISELQGFSPVVNGAFWVVLCLLAPLNGWIVVTRLMRPGPHAVALHPLPFLAVFYAVVSAHYQIPIYLTYTVAMSLAALLWLSSESRRPIGRVAPVLALGLSLVGLHYHAAQPLSRGFKGIVEGHRVAVDTPCPGSRCGLRIDSGEAAGYADVLALIDQHTEGTDAIFALPVDPELYFLSGRRNPFTFFSTAFGVQDDAAVASLEAAIISDPPKLVFVKPDDKYLTPTSRRIVRFVAQRYELLGNRGGFDVYIFRRSRQSAER